MLSLWLGTLAVFWFTSEGEPVCEGPLILDVDDSFPPQCDPPIDSVISVGLQLLTAAAFVAVIGSLLLTGVRRFRAR